MKLYRRLLPILTVLAALPLARNLSAQSSADWRYAVGLRSTVMAQSMSLSTLGGGFQDLPAGGEALPHSSSLFVVWPLGAHLRLGVETLVGNSYEGGDSEILFQASGLTAEYQTAGTWFAAVSVQGGGIIVSATRSSESDGESGALRTGASYKESGLFLAPQLSVGRRLGSFDLRLVGKQVWNLGAESLGAFDSFYAGVSVGVIRR